MNTSNAYDTLYENMKNRFTIIKGNEEYNLGEFMLMKAGKKKETPVSNLPAVRNDVSTEKAITTFFRYVNDKLTLKEPPIKDKTIKKFPLRTSFASVLSAIVACTLVISYGTISMRNAGKDMPATAEIVETYNEAENDASQTQK